MNEQLTWFRLSLLLRNDIIGGYRSVLTTSIVLAIIIMFTAILPAGFGHIQHSHYIGWFIGMLFIWGTVNASCIFSELHDKTKNEAYLLLPASALEKTITRALSASVIFVAYLLLFTLLASLITEGINMMLFGRHNELFDPLDPHVGEAIAMFLVIQSVFFLGGAWFKNRQWFKTILSVFIIGIALGLLALITFRIFFADFFIGLLVPAPELFVAVSTIFNSDSVVLFHSVSIVLEIVYFVLLAPFCWFVAWLRVKETQVSHGV